MSVTDVLIGSSFRDPSGFVFSRDGSIYRQVSSGYRENYERLMMSGLYKALVEDRLLVSHEEVDIAASALEKAYRIIRPEPIPYISYPYEWSFSQMKDAALATLKIQKRALEFGMSLKDSSAYNIQFQGGRPILIDTLSFEEYQEGAPWVAYGQFCQHFLSPLALMRHKDIRLNQLLRVYMDGIPLDLTSRLLPVRTYFRFSLLSHVHLHAIYQRRFGKKNEKPNSSSRISKLALLGLIDSLESAVRKLKWEPKGTEWADYYDDTNYSSSAFRHKMRLVAEFLDKVSPHVVWDLGANDGTFSRIAAHKGIPVYAFDCDPAAVELNYLKCVRDGETHILPLLLDLTNPSPAIGWGNSERMSFLGRGPVDTVLALAVIHHLAIGNNLPLSKIASFFNEITRSWLIIEFIPKTDSQVRKMLYSREDVFPDYSEQNFEHEFSRYFRFYDCVAIDGSGRKLFIMGKE